MNVRNRLILLLLLLGGCSKTPPLQPSVAIPLPFDLQLVPPAPTVPAPLAAFAGAWGGDAWQGILPHILVVERVDSAGAAQVIYAFGDSADGKIKGVWTRRTGVVSRSGLHFTLQNGAVLEYVMNPDGTLLGRYFLRAAPSYVRLGRIPGGSAALLEAAANAVPHLWSEISIPEHSRVGETSGKALTLQALLYRTSRPGPRPLIIINHGSSDNGAFPRTQMVRAVDGAMPRIFLSLGYNVVAPLRKGFGATNTPMLEELPSHYPQEVQLDSAVEDLDATVDFMRSQAYVDPQQIILAGQSRGGMLAVVYAGRYPAKVAGVLNFSGGWWGEHMPTADFNLTQFSQAGQAAKVPMLWLYADHDTYYTLPFVERGFAEFRASGGMGELVEVHDLPGNGHFLSAWPDRWQATVAAYLETLK